MTKIRAAIALVVTAGLLAGAGTLMGDRNDRYETIVVSRSDIEATVSAIGTLKPRLQVEVGARVSGQIDRLHVKAGDIVDKGQLLAEIDPRIPQAAVNAGRAELANLRAKLTEQQAQLELTEQQHARQQQMLKDGSASLDAMQSAAAQYKMAAARVEQLKAQVEQVQSTLGGDETQLEYTRIYAPIAGTVISMTAEEGQTLNATYQTPALLHIADLSAMTVWTDVSEADIRKISADMPVYFTTLGGAGRRWQGRVRQILPAPPIKEARSESSTALAPSSRKVILYTALFDVDNADGALMPQMTAQASFVVAAATAVPVVPLPALAALADRPGLYQARVIDAKGRLEQREVKIGVRTRLSAEVLAGLQPGERLITGEKTAASAPRRFTW